MVVDKEELKQLIIKAREALLADNCDGSCFPNTCKTCLALRATHDTLIYLQQKDGIQ